jgi:hypothetical protein
MKAVPCLALVVGLAASALVAHGKSPAAMDGQSIGRLNTASGFHYVLPAQAPLSPAPVAPAIVMSGRVIADVTGDPIANARVTLSPEPPMPPVTLTDVDGRFSLTAPAGRYRVVAGKTGYAQREAPSAIPEQAVEIRLKKGAAISGHVLDEAGDPVIGVHVAALMRVGSAPDATTVSS